MQSSPTPLPGLTSIYESYLPIALTVKHLQYVPLQISSEISALKDGLRPPEAEPLRHPSVDHFSFPIAGAIPLPRKAKSLHTARSDIYKSLLPRAVIGMFILKQSRLKHKSRTPQLPRYLQGKASMRIILRLITKFRQPQQQRTNISICCPSFLDISS